MKDISNILKQGIQNQLRESCFFEEFINGTQRELHFSIHNIHVVLYRENESSSFHYEFPYVIDLQSHMEALWWMSYVLPYLREAIKKHDEENLYAPGSKVYGTLRYT